MVTQKTIADKLGVSQAAVSIALTGYKGGRISQEIKKSIIREASLLGYEIRDTSKRKKSRIIALLSVMRDKEETYFSRLLMGVQDIAHESSCIVTPHIVKNNELPEHLISSIDGIIATDAFLDLGLPKIANDIPIIFLNTDEQTGRYDTVMPDNNNGIRKAVRHLYSLGHRKFAFFGIREFIIHDAERYGAYHQIISELNLPAPDPSWVSIPFRKERTLEDVEQKASETLTAIKKMKNRPTAIICSSDLYASAFIRLAPVFGFKIPDDISITGFDDMPDSYGVSPSISTVAQPMEEMGRIAMRLLYERIDGNDAPPMHLKADVEWMPRGSIGRPSS
ncbi:MAG TPA: hypothetical protein DCZ94_16275 [Lentisphaeria bacterium]|nr:MAG: hypothetical protein A2X48_02060 [Lentisphaerae bacterium GWF2_49_21]HBC88506.1 hypothetical protein [Lentisphaeria bacterium]